ncbi:hypothetical protein [Gordonia sp. (in: high G+C Gram-positive bacteria)]|uniref:hypothetical protein n=1 Tax=Gordonia sp. (in: high G+C Gram-positive bacteria) TaxID=84139 RepID=UPI003F970466
MRTQRQVLRVLTAMMAIVIVLVAGGCKGNDSESSTAADNSGANSQSENASGEFSCPEKNTIKFAKTKFTWHAGAGFGAFHRWIYKPAKAGTFKKGADGRVKAFVKAGAAALFVKRQVRLASEDAKANPTLCKSIVKPMKSISDKVSDAVKSARKGDLGEIDSLNGDISSVMTQSKDQGSEITPDEKVNIGK